MYCTMFCNISMCILCITIYLLFGLCKLTYSLTYSHTPNLEMLSHLKRCIKNATISGSFTDGKGRCYSGGNQHPNLQCARVAYYWAAWILSGCSRLLILISLPSVSIAGLGNHVVFSFQFKIMVLEI